MNTANNAFVPDPKEIARCRGCKARIFFARTGRMRDKGTKHVLMVIDVNPVGDGNLSLSRKFDAGLGRPVAHVEVVSLGQAAGMRALGLPTYQDHHRHCPNADDFRHRPP